jgi:signal transduction histidine kinase
MNEDQAQEQSTSPVDLSRASIRAQLLWASLFPLAFFGLLSTLVTSSALNQMMLNLVTQRNAAQVQVLADSLTLDFSAELIPASSTLNSVLQTLDPVEGSRLYLIDADGKLLASSEAGLNRLPLNVDELALLIQDHKPGSQLMESTATLDKVVISIAPLPGKRLGVILEEPWAANMSPAFYYQLVLVGLLALGTALSLGMLSLGIGRVIRPIAVLAKNATGAVPGSIFRPVPERGPLEIQVLTRAFNQMVISLAEQQTILRQYAHKALLSQEKERQRLSHELHDGTVQDLVGLTQRVELCRNELDRDPLLARRRLDELHGLLEQTLSDVRRISNALRPSILEDLGLSTALQALCNDIEQQMPSLHCYFTITGLERRLMPDLELAIFRVVQEALSNIRKHACQATRVGVELIFQEDEVATLVYNDGPTFSIPDVRNLVRSGHLGLAGMYERAHLFHGELTITSNPAAGTKVSLRLPCLAESVGTETGASMRG